MKKAILMVAVLMFLSVPVLAEEKAVKIPIPSQAQAEVTYAQCLADKASWYAIAEAYRMQLSKLGWDCKMQSGNVVCNVKSNEKEK